MTTNPNDRRASDDSRERLIRVEESLRHIGEVLAGIKDTLEKQNQIHIQDFKDTNARVLTIEQRVDKIYWLGGLVTFLGLPTTVYIVQTLITHFGK